MPSGRRAFDDDPIDAEFEVQPRNTDLAEPDLRRLPGPEGTPPPLPESPTQPKNRWPWWKIGATIAATGAGIVGKNLLDWHSSQANVEPYPEPLDGQSGGVMVGGAGEEYGPMSRQELAGRKPFHALTPEERIRFLRSRVTQPTPSTLTRPY